MAQLAANSPQRGPRMSQVLPTVKCSSCNYSVPLDKLGDHVCALPPPLPSSSDTKPMPRQPTLHTALSPPNAAHRSPRDTRSPPMIPSIIPQDIRRQHSARLRNSPSPAPSRGAPSPAPSRNGVRSPGPLSLMVPPSRTQSPFTPASSARQMIPRHSERVSDLPPDPRDRPRPDAAPSILSGNTQPLTFRATSSNAPIPPALDARSRPSAPLSPLAQGFQGVHDPRPALVHAEPGHHFRSPASPAPSNYSSRSQHFMGPEIDTKSGGVAGMAGVGRRGFAAAARAALFAAPPVSRLPSPAPMSPAHGILHRILVKVWTVCESTYLLWQF
ncbi:hypothetical protein BJV78DRAFT_1278317 [Lactifluus subvellereus]|nr:hypothetical protein BJV78DRAFT_1278317 [Lactifluus subvellereus]